MSYSISRKVSNDMTELAKQAQAAGRLDEAAQYRSNGREWEKQAESHEWAQGRELDLKNRAARPERTPARPHAARRTPAQKITHRDTTAANDLAEAPVKIATYTPEIFLTERYAAYALAYLTRCANFDCPGMPEHAAEGASAAYLQLISRDYSKTKNRITSHLHALRSAKYQARRRNWYAPGSTDKNNRRADKRMYCPGMGSQYQYGANPKAIFWSLEKAERLAAEHAAEPTAHGRRDKIYPGTADKGQRPARLSTADVSLTEYADAVRSGAE